MNEGTTVGRREEMEKNSQIMPQFKERYDMQQSQLKHEIKEEGVFTVVNSHNLPFEQDFSGMDRNFVNKIKSKEFYLIN